MTKDQDEVELTEEEKEFLLEYIKQQNEALKRIYKHTLKKDNQPSQES
ncbi:hypothetical protein [Bacillus sp. USDA818B3_A]|nr:hypothetical protein [Bacillus sp. USDA818B3_A]